MVNGICDETEDLRLTIEAEAIAAAVVVEVSKAKIMNETLKKMKK